MTSPPYFALKSPRGTVPQIITLLGKRGSHQEKKAKYGSYTEGATLQDFLLKDVENT